jgi:palmitoyltransferase ZDHHC13/17
MSTVIQSDGAAASGAPTQPASKANAAAPRLTSQDVEMGDLGPGDQASPDIMQLARVGDIPAMQRLFDAGDLDATYADEEGITPLHWSAINNQYAMCKFLLENGAQVNTKGGESIATPLQWAAQRSNYYTVNLLLQHGADPLITDAQGYNTLHISTFNGNVLLIVLLLHQGIPVDVADAYGHTSLMWAAYKGFPQCVDLFLRWGASVHTTDEQGFTALHWALVKGSPQCILKLIEYGADRFAKTDTGKTPAITAKDLNTIGAWHRALKECGYGEDAHPVVPWWPGSSFFLKDKRGFMNKFLFLLPTALLWAELMTVAYLPLVLSLFLAFLIGFGFQWVTNQILEYAPPDMRHLHRTVRILVCDPNSMLTSFQPWLAGIFAGSLFLVGVRWLTVVLPGKSSQHPCLAVTARLTMYAFSYVFSTSSFKFPLHSTIRPDHLFLCVMHGF